MAEKRSRAICVPEAKFFTAFPVAWKEKINMKVRRANQIIRVFGMYLCLLLKKLIKTPVIVIVQVIIIYFFKKIIFIFLIATTVLLMLEFPYFVLTLAVFLIPKVGSYLFEIVQNYIVLISGIFSFALNKKLVVWSKPANRALLTKEMLLRHGLISTMEG